jgi:aspartyl-tRNA(Asn)/glutamyl-tRNA(Gln) amidotransferase subunit A
VDAILSPTAPTTAFKFGEKMDNPLQMYLSDVCTVAIGLAGLLGLVIPCDFSAAALPIGFQLIGKAFHEGELLTIARQFEKAHDFFQRYSKISQLLTGIVRADAFF